MEQGTEQRRPALPRLDRGTVAAWIGALVLALGWAFIFTQPFFGRGTRQGTVAGVTDPAEPAANEAFVRIHLPESEDRTYPVAVSRTMTMADLVQSVQEQYRVPFTLTILGRTTDQYLTAAAGKDSTLLAAWVVYANGTRVWEPLNRTIVRAGETVDLFWERSVALPVE